MRNILLLVSLISGVSFSQTNITFTHSNAAAILNGNFTPQDFLPSNPISNPHQIAHEIALNVSADSLKSYILKLATFENRNSGSDTLSAIRGIGAARRWAMQKLQQISAQNENRLVTSYLQFDQNMCGIINHRNVLGILPGSDTSNHQIILIEGHMDSRCEVLCDTTCFAQGIEDNATGTALVLELARVMSPYTFKNTIVFMITTGEEQGLYGANAMALYAQQNSLPIEAVLNNDVIGGILCGNSSSAPSCPGLNDIDSLQVRLFSQGGFNSRNKQLSRFIKLQYEEELQSTVAVPMMLTIMSAEDRTGRGGDHIPFRQKGFAAMRFTSANEHGDASNGPGYTDRQHTSEDVLGIDTNNDQVIDSFFVDFNYLARNTVINGNAAAQAAIGPTAIDFDYSTFFGPDPSLVVSMSDPIGHPNYRIAIRTTTNDWDSVYTTNQTSDTLVLLPGTNYFVSVSSVDNNGIESLFSREVFIGSDEVSLDEAPTYNGLELLQNRPNPFDEATIIGVRLSNTFHYQNAYIAIQDLNGKIIEKLPIQLEPGMNEVVYEHGFGKVGVFFYSLVVDDKIVAQNKMIFAN